MAKGQREILEQYKFFRDGLRMTDEEMAEAGGKITQFMEGVQRSDELAASVSLGAFKFLERGDVDAAKKRLMIPIGSYYRLYRQKGGDTNLLERIEATAREYSSIAAETSRKIE
jgi:hypothetical protein